MNIPDDILEAAAKYPGLEPYSTGGGCDFIMRFQDREKGYPVMILHHDEDGSSPDSLEDSCGVAIYIDEYQEDGIDLHFDKVTTALAFMAAVDNFHVFRPTPARTWKEHPGKYSVPVRFEGRVTVEVPSDLNEKTAMMLAEKMAICRVIATTNNPDAPDEAACEEFESESALSEDAAEYYWDNSKPTGVCGTWTLPNNQP